MIDESIPVGVSGSLLSLLDGDEVWWVSDMTCDKVVDGVRIEDAVKGVSVAGDGGTRRAGLGKVLNVDPREVYLIQTNLNPR